MSLAANVRQILYPQDEICLGGKTGMYFRFATSGTLQEAERATDTIGARLRVDAATRSVFLDNRLTEIRLSPQQFDLVALLWNRRPNVCTFGEICEELWNDEYQSHWVTVPEDIRERINQLVYELRASMKPYLEGRNIVESRWGVGYRLTD